MAAPPVGAAVFLRVEEKRGHGVPCPYGSGEKFADGFRPAVKIQFGTVGEEFGDLRERMKAEG